MSTALQALNSARTYLNDDDAALWTDPRLLPKLQEAHRELQNRLLLAGIPVIKTITSVLTVAAFVTDLTTVSGYPTDLVTPIQMKEKQVGQDVADFCDMVEVDYIPQVDQTNYLSYWCWQGEKILLLGATNAVQVLLKYEKGLPIPSKVTDPIGFINGELYLATKTAALACGSADQDKATYLDGLADQKLDILIRINVKQGQNLPARQRGYHRGKWRNRFGWW